MPPVGVIGNSVAGAVWFLQYHLGERTKNRMRRGVGWARRVRHRRHLVIKDEKHAQFVVARQQQQKTSRLERIRFEITQRFQIPGYREAFCECGQGSYVTYCTLWIAAWCAYHATAAGLSFR
jgi:hypothetical protein